MIIFNFKYIYIFFLGKSEKNYMRVHQEIINIFNDKNFPLEKKTIIQDFEIAAINAARKVYSGNAIIHGCFFHLSQSFLKKVCSIGLKKQYSTNMNINTYVKMYMALAFLPCEDIITAFEEIKLDTPKELEDFITYVSEYYIHGSNGNGPRYPPSLWTTNHENGMASRTQNYLESFHSKINRVIGASHVGVFRLMGELQKEIIEQEHEIAQALNGTGRKGPKGKFKERNKRIETILSNRDSYKTFKELLEALSTCIGNEFLPMHLDD